MGLIYKIINDINDKVYIGKTCTTLNHRWDQHLYSYQIEDWNLYKAMRKYGIEHFTIIEVEQINDNLLNEREIYWIKYYNSYKNGYNMTEGGDGRIQLNRNFIKEKWLNGWSTKQIAKELSCWTSSVIQVLKELNLYNKEEVAKRKQIEIANTQSSDKIIQYDENGNIINKFNSVLEAATFINGIPDTIHGAITSGGSRYGFFWGYENGKKPNFHKIIIPQYKKIKQYDLNNNYITTYDSAADAARKNNFSSPSTILKACKGQRKTAYNYIWKYEE